MNIKYKVINLKLLCVVILFSAGNYILYRFYGSASWYRNLIKSGLDRLLFAFIVQSFIYMKNHKVRNFVMEEMIQHGPHLKLQQSIMITSQCVKEKGSQDWMELIVKFSKKELLIKKQDIVVPNHVVLVVVDEILATL